MRKGGYGPQKGICDRVVLGLLRSGAPGFVRGRWKGADGRRTRGRIPQEVPNRGSSRIFDPRRNGGRSQDHNRKRASPPAEGGVEGGKPEIGVDAMGSRGTAIEADSQTVPGHLEVVPQGRCAGQAATPQAVWAPEAGCLPIAFPLKEMPPLLANLAFVEVGSQQMSQRRATVATERVAV
jgi:hypothetical protein